VGNPALSDNERDAIKKGYLDLELIHRSIDRKLSDPNAGPGFDARKKGALGKLLAAVHGARNRLLNQTLEV